MSAGNAEDDVLGRLCDALRAFHVREARIRAAADVVAEAAAQGYGVLLTVTADDVRAEVCPHLPPGEAYVLRADLLAWAVPGGR